MNHCKDCKWWGVSKGLLNGTMQECYLTISNQTDPLHPQSLAWADADEPVGVSVLYTLPDFGCIQFEARV
jgi:hypothetical protein